MRLILILLVILCIGSCTSTKYNFNSTLYTLNNTNDSILKKLSLKFDLLIYTNIIEHRGYNTNYKIIGKINSNWYKIRYQLNSYYSTASQLPYTLTQSRISKRKGKLIINTFTINNFETI